MQHTFIFEQKKSTTSIYFLKQSMLNLEIDIEVLSLKIEENELNINYLVKDSNNEYEYKIEMSDNR